jgi:two-component sensor histidine kinase/tetratricopeptide (TPR) repeat protein
MLKLLIIVFSFSILSTVSGKNCYDPGLKKFQQKMQSFIDEYKANAAINYSDSILNIILQKSQIDCDSYFHILLLRGEAYELNKKFEIALDLYYDILRQAEPSNNWKMIALTHLSIARAFEAVGRPAECNQYLNTARTIIYKHNLNEVYAIYCLRNSSYHRIYDNRDTAIYYARNSINFGRRFNVQRSVFDGHLLMGILSSELDSSVFHFREAIKIFIQNRDFHGASSQALNIASKFVRAGRYEDARIAIDESIAYLDRMEEKSESYFGMSARIDHLKSLVFEKYNKLDSAYFYLKSGNEKSDKALWYADQEKITESLVEFAIEKEKDKVKSAERISFVLIVGLIVMACLVLILIWVVINNQKKRKQITAQNQIISSKNEALNQSVHKQSILLSEVHHRVKNNLQLVISLLTLHGHKTNNVSVKHYLDDLARKVFSIALIHEQLYQSGDFERIDTKEYINELTSNFRVLSDANKHVEFEIDFSHILMNLETVLPLGIICSELISNSLKYANVSNENIKIFISLKTIGSKYLFKYMDNGPGFPADITSSSNQGMGFTLINNMVRQLQGESSRYNQSGAVFTLLFNEKTISLV